MQDMHPKNGPSLSVGEQLRWIRQLQNIHRLFNLHRLNVHFRDSYTIGTFHVLLDNRYQQHQ